MPSSPQKFPGFYPTVIDQSFAPVTLSRFRGGLVGVANKGPFNTPTLVNSLTEYQQKFGTSDVSAADWQGQLAVAAATIADFSGSSMVVRVGHQYEQVGTLISGLAASGTILAVTFANHLTVGDFLRILEPGSETSVNLEVASISGNNVTLTAAVDVTYDPNAVVFKSDQLDAANSAEAFLTAFDFVTREVGQHVSATVSGTKGEFTFEVTDDLSKVQISTIVAAGGFATVTTASAHNYLVGDQISIANVTSTAELNGTYTVTEVNSSLIFKYATLTTFSGSGTPISGIMTTAALSAGDFIKIHDSTHLDTGEVLVKSVVPNNTTGGCTVTLYPSSSTASGYQALTLQANYTAAKIYKVKRANGTGAGGTFATYRVLHLFASSEGTWANSDPVTNTNLVVQVGPGTANGSKKLMVFYNTQLVETLDNLTVDDSTADTYLPTYVNAHSQYVRVGYLGYGDDFLVADNPPDGITPANTLNGWNIANLGGAVNVANFSNGYNGAYTTNADWVGELEPSTDLYTGLLSFKNNTDNIPNVVAAPGATDTDIQQNLVALARTINAEAILDVPSTFNPRQYADWRNAEGQFIDRVKIDDWHGALFGNWTEQADPFVDETRVVPPSISVLRCLARTFNQDKPWFAAAGDVRGFIDNAVGIQFITINASSKTADYNSQVNLLLSDAGRIQVYGDKTLQVADSKLSELHVAILVNYIVANIGAIGKQFIFDPNDTVLLSQLNQAVSQFMDGILNERGVEQYRLVVDTSNNNSATRNLRNVIIDLAIVPVSTAERVFLNLTVNRSGAQLNSATQ